MRFEFSVGQPPNDTMVEFIRNPWIGTVTARVNGQLIRLRSALHPSTWYSVDRIRRYEIPDADPGGRAIVVEHERPRWWAGLRPNTYRVFVGEDQIAVHRGY